MDPELEKAMRAASEVTWGEALTLPEYVEVLLSRGLRSTDLEFVVLIQLYGDKKIRDLARAFFKRGKT